MSKDGMPPRKVIRQSVEYNLTEHCNLTCYGCGHASPLLPKKFASLEDFSSDFEALSAAFHSVEVRILGGEPLLHPQLLDFLAEARRVGVADEVVVYTNGVLLHQAPKEFYRRIDQLVISSYPGVHRRLDDGRCADLCRDHGVKLLILGIDKFQNNTVNSRITDQGLVDAIYRTCNQREDCHTVYEGRFYKCPVGCFTAARLALIGEAFEEGPDDGVSLHRNPDLRAQLEQYLADPNPMAACSYCLGSLGPDVPHRQLNRIGRQKWLQEDGLTDIEAVRQILSGRGR